MGEGQNMRRVELPREIFANKNAFTTEALTARRLPIEHFRHIDAPETGGLFAYWLIYPFPTKAFPLQDAIKANNSIKKMLIGALRIMEALKYVLAVLLFVLPRRYKERVMLTAMEAFVLWAEWECYNFKLVPKRFCAAVREVYDKTKEYLDKKYEGRKLDIYSRLLHIVCSAVNYDSGYCYPLQDIAMEINKNELRKHPRKELRRLYGLLIGRDRRGGMNERFALFLRAALLVIRFKRGLFNKIVDVIDTLDLSGLTFADIEKYKLPNETMEEYGRRMDFSRFKSPPKEIIKWEELPPHSTEQRVGFDHADWYHCAGGSEYDFGSVSFGARWRLRRRLDEWWMAKMQKEGKIALQKIVAIEEKDKQCSEKR